MWSGGRKWDMPYATYRWAVVMPVTLFISITALGVIFSYSEFIAFIGIARPLWSRTVVQTSLSIQGFMGGVIPFLVGADLQPRLRTYAIGGVLLVCGGIELAAVAVLYDMQWLYYLGGGLIQGVGYGALYISTLQHMMKWFPDRPGFVAGLLGLFLGLGAMIFTNVNFQLCASRGPGRALLILSFICLIAALPCACLMEWPPADFQPKRAGASSSSASAGSPVAAAGARPAFKALTRTQVLRTREFWLICGVVFLTLSPGWGLVSVYTPLFQRIMPHAASETETERHAMATQLTTLANAAYTAGRLGWGAASDYLGNKTCYYIFLICQAALFALLPLAAQSSFPLFFFFLCVICTVYGGSKVLLAPTVAEYLHAENANTGVGMSLIAIAGAALTGPGMVTLFTHSNQLQSGADPTRMYDSYFYSMSVMTGVGLLFLTPLSPLARDEQSAVYNEIPLDVLPEHASSFLAGGANANDELDDSGDDDADRDADDDAAEKHFAAVRNSHKHAHKNNSSPPASPPVRTPATAAVVPPLDPKRAQIVALSGFSPATTPDAAAAAAAAASNVASLLRSAIPPPPAVAASPPAPLWALPQPSTPRERDSSDAI